MPPNIEKTIRVFNAPVKSDKNHRNLSWEHCYTYFGRKKEDIDRDAACLHLAFYLASWGMYRGSSFLLWKDYLIHQNVVDMLLKNLELRKVSFVDCSENKISEIVELCKSVRGCYSNIKVVDDEKVEVKATDTLVTKIVLGTLGCVPAYDRYFIEGLKKEGIRPCTPSQRGLEAIVKFYRNNQKDFDQMQSIIKTGTNEAYPIMKLIDMYLVQVGINQNQKKAKASKK